jgi:hypothetical protein
MAVLIFIENAAGILLSWRFCLGARPLALGLIATAVTAFVFLLALTQKTGGTDWKLTDAELRPTLAGTLILVYFALLGMVAFWQPTNNEEAKQLLEVTKTMVGNFTTLIGAVVAFYFGSSAYLQAKKSPKTT